MEKTAIQTEHVGSFMKLGKHSPGNRRWVQEGKVKNPVASRSAKSEGRSSPGNEGGGVQVLAEKMKELELMGSADMEHVLDLEEALHYYSLLTTPVFLDIVHKFFMDIYSEFSMARQPARMNNSKRRFSSMEF
ncbi:uncharacterized protein J3R85_013471 [Psidium guajava]|nr:uncharacterized protein J3R85_013471 [Psidium guajava]